MPSSIIPTLPFTLNAVPFLSDVLVDASSRIGAHHLGMWQGHSWRGCWHGRRLHGGLSRGEDGIHHVGRLKRVAALIEQHVCAVWPVVLL